MKSILALSFTLVVLTSAAAADRAGSSPSIAPVDARTEDTTVLRRQVSELKLRRLFLAPGVAKEEKTRAFGRHLSEFGTPGAEALLGFASSPEARAALCDTYGRSGGSVPMSVALTSFSGGPTTGKLYADNSWGPGQNFLVGAVPGDVRISPCTKTIHIPEEGTGDSRGVLFSEAPPRLTVHFGRVFLWKNMPVIRDKKTGASWQVAKNPEMPTDQALTFCASLDLDGKGWRLPTVSEALRLHDETLNCGELENANGPEYCSEFMTGTLVEDLLPDCPKKCSARKGVVFYSEASKAATCSCVAAATFHCVR